MFFLVQCGEHSNMVQNIFEIFFKIMTIGTGLFPVEYKQEEYPKCVENPTEYMSAILQPCDWFKIIGQKQKTVPESRTVSYK